MSTPPDRESQLVSFVRSQIERMRVRTQGKLPREEQEELAVLLEDLLRSHPVLSRWVRSLLPGREVAQTAEVLRAAETVDRPDSGRSDSALSEDPRALASRGTRQAPAKDAAPAVRAGRAVVAGRPPGKKAKKAGGAR